MATNSDYAIPLEYGTEHMLGFHVARDTARKMAPVFKEKLTKAVLDPFK